MKTPLAGSNAMDRIRVFLMATCLVAGTQRLSGDIILISRLSDAYAFASPVGPCYPHPSQSQTGFLPANLSDHSQCCGHTFCYEASATSNSSIFLNNPMGGLRVVGDGTATVTGGYARAKLIILSFTLTEVPYPYSITGQLNGADASATLTGETGTIFERTGTTTLSESGILPPGNYTLSVNVAASGGPQFNSSASFTFALDGAVSVTRLTNLSTRLLVGTGADVGIGGFIITGSGPRHLLLRGVGPSLSQFGVPNALVDPVMELHGPSGFTTVTNDNWRDTQEAAIIATGGAPSNDLESAIVTDLAPGFYTAILAGKAGTTGVGLVEIYDLSTNQDSRLANISTRANVSTGDNIVIAGFILSGVSAQDGIILRGIGPSLSETGVNALPDPKLELRDSQGALIMSNDNWMDHGNQAAIIQAAGLAPGNNLESAIAVTLTPGEYTALLSGVNNGTGVGLVEVYENPAIGPTPSPTPTPAGSPTPTATPGGSATPSPTPVGTPTPTPTPATCVESFDGVTAPALPSGWVASNPVPGNGVVWVTSTVDPDTPPNGAFLPDQDGLSDKVLDRAGIMIKASVATLTFRNNFDTECDGVLCDGGVLEVSAPNISNGDFLDITDPLVGGKCLMGCYNQTTSGGRMGWGGDSGGYIDTVFNLGPNLGGQTITLRWRFLSDEAVSAPGWRIDTLSITEASCP